jgi:hypothetical protein
LANLEWSVPHTIESPEGSLDLNVPDPVTGRCFRIYPDGYRIVPSLRVTQDNVSQADGSVLHPRWKTGMTAALRVGFQIAQGDGTGDYVPACGLDLREMNDELALHLNALRTLTTTTQRLLWSPEDYGGERRMLDQVQLLSWPSPSFDVNEAFQEFSLETPFPYAEDATEQSHSLLAGTAFTTITNAGTAAFSPVVRVMGSFFGFVLSNLDDTDSDATPLEVLYDSTRPGALAVGPGDYAEIDFFRGTIYLNGDEASLIAGIDPTFSDFWRLVPGGNDITLSGAVTATILWNNAWA